jgi:hypothetical protein
MFLQNHEKIREILSCLHVQFPVEHISDLTHCNAKTVHGYHYTLIIS